MRTVRASALVLGAVSQLLPYADAQAQATDVVIDAVVTARFSVGTVDGGGWDMFGSITAVAFDGAGRLYILDAANRRLTQVGADGRFIRSIGRMGRGPGEFSRPVGLAVTRDQLVVVFDAGQSQFTVFDTAGTFLRSSRPPFGSAYPGQRLRAHPDGGVLAASGDGVAILVPGEREPEGYHLNRYALDASPPTLAARASRHGVPGGPDRAASGSNASRRVGVTALAAFAPQLHFDVLPDRRVALVDSSTYVVQLWANGVLTGRLTRPLPPRRTTEADRRAEVERRRERAPVRGGIALAPTGTVDQMLRSLVAWPERVVVAGLRASPDGLLWVGRRTDDARMPVDLWRGEAYVGTIRHPLLRMPDALGPSGLVAVIEEGDSGEPVVRVLSVMLPPGAR